MNKLTTLLFPDTVASVESMNQELFFFEQIMFYLPEEQDPAQEQTHPEEDQLCRGYSPAPLGEDRERFAMLLQELKGHEKEFYNGQLSSMTLEYMENRDTETTLELIMNMQGNPVPKRQNRKTDEEKILWQARLLLKLAEIRKKEDKEIGDVLSSIAEKESRLFQQLKGAGDITETHMPPSGIMPAPIKIEPLLKAWGRLFLVDNQPTWILNTANEEAGAILLDVDETKSKQTPEKICRLPLPEVDLTKFAWNRKTFHSQAASTITDLGTLLREMADKGCNDVICRQLEQAASEWETHLNEQRLIQGTSNLEFYCCSSSLGSILAHLCKTKEAAARQAGYPAHGIIAIRRQDSAQ